MEKRNNNDKEKTRRISIVQMIIVFIKEKQYGKAIMTFFAGVVGCFYFITLIRGAIAIIIEDSFHNILV